jgi:hypothetical protein
VSIGVSVKRWQAARENVVHFPSSFFGDVGVEALFATDVWLCGLHVVCASRSFEQNARRFPISRHATYLRIFSDIEQLGGQVGL